MNTPTHIMKEDSAGECDNLSIVNPISRSFSAIPKSFSNLWTNRSLIRNFVSRDISQRYRKSIVGYFWIILEPLLLSAVYYMLFIIIAERTEERLPLWIILGVITWQYFAKSLNESVNSLTSNKNMIKQIYFPREIFAVSKTFAQLIITTISLVVTIPFLIHLGIQPTWQLLLVPLALIMVTFQVLGVGWLLAVPNVQNGDISHLIRFITRAGFFISPVMWQMSMAIDRAGDKAELITYLYILNPMVVPLEMMRAAFDGTTPPIPNWAIYWSMAFSVLVLLMGLTVFKKYESKVVKRL